MKVYLIRHAESEGNVKKSFDKKLNDWNLSKKGEKQARKLARKLKNLNVEAVYGSTLSRTFQTAKPFLKNKSIEFIKDKRLNEFNHGEIKGNWEEAIKYRKKLAKKLGIGFSEVKLPKGESIKDHFDKTNSFMKDLINKKYKGNILIFSHGGTNRSIIKSIKKLDLNELQKIPQSNTAINELEWDGKNWKINKINSIKHLGIPKKAIKLFNKVRDSKYDVLTNNCWDKHKKLQKRLKKAGFGTLKAVEKFKWDDQKLPKEILKIPHPKVDYYLYLLVWIHGTGNIIDCSFDKKLPYYNKWDGENHTKVLVNGTRILSKEKEKIIEKSKEEIPKRLKEYHKFYDAVNNFWEEQRKT